MYDAVSRGRAPARSGLSGGRQERLREARGLGRQEPSVLECVLVVTAGAAVVCFTVWLLGFAGPGPSLAPQ